jgi:predicted transglutaminase-like cysteine proteinase
MRSRSRAKALRPSRRQLLGWLGWVGAAGLAGVAPVPAHAAEDPAVPPANIPGLFGWGETAVGDPRRYVPKSRVLDSVFADSERPILQAAAGGAWLRWQRMVAELPGRAPEAQILAVDRFVNAIAWVDDAALYGQEDHWASPAEFLSAEAGDCEDFAIAKYAALARLGFAEQRLRIALVYDRRRRVEHALAIVYWGGDALVLDSLGDAPTSHRNVTRYRPICSFNRQQLWVHRPV